MIGLNLAPGRLSVLCLGAHPDDIEIGCGGTLLALSCARSLDVRMLVLTGTPERKAEARAAAACFSSQVEPVDVQILDLPDGRLPAHWAEVKQALEDAATGSRRPDLIFAPRVDDSHQDHRLLGELVTTVWRDSLVLHYEIPKWDGDLARVNHYVALSDDIVQQKIVLLDQCFPSQIGRDWWDDQTFRALLRLRGIECRARWAEGFVAGRVVITL